MAEDVMFQEALEAIRQGQRIRARDLLTRLLRTNQNNAQYWLYMSSVVDTPREQIFCLQNVLRIEPDHPAAIQGMVLLGGRAPQGGVQPVAPVRRKWDVEVQDIEELTGFRAVMANPIVRIAFFSFVALAVVGLIGLGLYAQGIGRRPIAAVIPTNTEGPTPTYTLTPTALNETPRLTPTGTATLTGPQPLWMRLEATYTPTPVYVRTPHAANEAFRIAERALAAGDLPKALSNFDQAMQMSPEAADIPFYVGEVYRQQGRYSTALEAYDRALAINPNFAPALLGQALAQAGLGAKTKIRPDLDAAIQNDPNYLEAYLARAEYLLGQGEYDAALQDLDRVDQLQPNHPRAYLYRAQVNLAQEDNPAALENARKANQFDATNLFTYRVLAQAAALNDEYAQALDAIDVYLIYAPDDATAWMIKGQGLFLKKEYSGTLEALNHAIELDRKQTDAYYYRGLTLLELGQDPDRAVNDIYYILQIKPKSFQVNLDFGRALLADNRLSEALAQVRRALDLAETDAEKAQAYYYRALTYEAIGNVPTAIKDWKALLALPEEAAPAEWRELAEAHVKATVTPPPPTPTITRTPTVTRTPSRTPTGAPTPTPKPVKPTATP